MHTGDGKGKSTAAFGLALRAWSAGWPIGVFQFTTSPKWRVGEEGALKALGEVHAATGPLVVSKPHEVDMGSVRRPPWRG